MIACLPMYDWPETGEAVDALWAGIATRLHNAGLEVPASLTRGTEDLYPLWTDPDLVVGQTCGIPYLTALHEQVQVFGSPIFDFDPAANVEPGDYYSLIVVSRRSGLTTLAEAADGVAAYNSNDSQSGFVSLLIELAALGARHPDRPFFAGSIATGGHRQSIRAIAAGTADIAAIDAASFALAQRYEPAAAEVRVIGRTRPSPGTPFITANRFADRVDDLRWAVNDAIAELDPEHRDNLGLVGMRPRTGLDYRIQKQRWDAAVSALGSGALSAA